MQETDITDLDFDFNALDGYSDGECNHHYRLQVMTHIDS